MVKLNMSGVGTRPEPIPEGVVQAALTGHKTYMESQSSGNPYVSLEFTVDDGGRKLFQNHSLLPQSLWALKKTLVQGLEIPEGDLAEDFDVDELLAANYGTRVDIEVGLRKIVDKKTKEEYMGNNIVRIAPVGTLDANPAVTTAF